MATWKLFNFTSLSLTAARIYFSKTVTHWDGWDISAFHQFTPSGLLDLLSLLHWTIKETTLVSMMPLLIWSYIRGWKIFLFFQLILKIWGGWQTEDNGNFLNSNFNASDNLLGDRPLGLSIERFMVFNKMIPNPSELLWALYEDHKSSHLADNSF